MVVVFDDELVEHFDNLEHFDLSDINTEGKLYKFSYHGENKLLKKLYISDRINILWCV